MHFDQDREWRRFMFKLCADDDCRDHFAKMFIEDRNKKINAYHKEIAEMQIDLADAKAGKLKFQGPLDEYGNADEDD